ncbi:DUF6710 family protein [Enterococcus mundtii]|uniref:Uncharacterized protein n=1 Tax=Enterococcus mundtii TaxID=53346 RepID=A0ABQ0VFJ6_ENTMU|nr:DUF6710 family protein [Enterococcus mundtii]AUB54427.1 hypothetical protein EM4838_15525 [Enterococcus mundtii]GEL81429.1 hypothetical protein EMU01_25730 [Enterococcus mundtii]GEN18594.1 hypothetical protein LAC02_18750 [Ligilactobacillus acidipiscis]
MSDYLKVNSSKLQHHTNNPMFEKYIEQAKFIIAESPICEDELHPIFSFVKQITDYITIKAAMNSYSNPYPDIGNMFEKFFEGKGSKQSIEKISKILLKKTSRENTLSYKKEGYKVIDYDLSIDLANNPIVLNPWMLQRVVNAITSIATKDNEFDRKKGGKNIINKFYYPTGISICHGGHHSQYSAKIKGKGITSIQEVINIEKYYDYVKFNGEYFEYRFNKFKNFFLPHREYITTEDEFYAGILFEIGRLLKNRIDIFPKDIQKVIHYAEDD